MSSNFSMLRRAAIAVFTLALGVTAVAQAANTPDLALVKQPAERFERSIQLHQDQTRYRALLAEARKLDAAPKQDLFDRRTVDSSDYERHIGELRERIETARKAERAEPASGLAGGVSIETLEAIAACESGGDPTVVDASGTYYGKYQFDVGTWASVGGSGSPAAAPEAEQDYRASLLYTKAGSSPWPVCG